MSRPAVQHMMIVEGPHLHFKYVAGLAHDNDTLLLIDCAARYCTTTGPAQPRLWTRLHRLCLYFKLRCRCLLALELRRVESSNRTHAAVHQAKAKRFQCNQEQHSKLVVGFRLKYFFGSIDSLVRNLHLARFKCDNWSIVGISNVNFLDAVMPS